MLLEKHEPRPIPSCRCSLNTSFGAESHHTVALSHIILQEELAFLPGSMRLLYLRSLMPKRQTSTRRRTKKRETRRKTEKAGENIAKTTCNNNTNTAHEAGPRLSFLAQSFRGGRELENLWSLHKHGGRRTVTIQPHFSVGCSLLLLRQYYNVSH